MTYLLALDQGTSSSRSIVFDASGQVVSMAQQELPQIYPQPGWVEHDPITIWQTQLATAKAALAKAGITARQVHAVGITNQRETSVVWNRRTGQPIHHAIVWQDRRAEPTCADLRARGHEALVQTKTGLLIDAYFSGTKLRWLLDHVPGARAQAESGELAFGTVDSWLIWQLTGGAVHATDVSNASRTMLFNVHTLAWDPQLLALLNIPASVLPQVVPSSGVLGETDPSVLGLALPIAGVAGDQQAATFGQACFQKGSSKNTYGTGSFVLMNVGTTCPQPTEGMLTTVAWDLGTGETTYALEGAIFVTGSAIQWLRDGINIIDHASQIGPLAESVAHTGGVVVVPAFTGLGSPWWDPYARGAILGITRGTTSAHIARAVVESIAFQTRDVVDAMTSAAGVSVTDMRVDGGAAVMDILLQLQANQLGVNVLRPRELETTAMGAAFLAGLAEGVWPSLQSVTDAWQLDQQFVPSPSGTESNDYELWKRAVSRSLQWARD